MSINTQIEDFRRILAKNWPDLDPQAKDRIVRFYELVVEENDRQNLTRLISPKDFFEGHVLDVKTLLGTDFLVFPAVDLGSGVGVPGLLAGLIRPDHWILVESEKKKAEFLRAAVTKLGAGHVSVAADRIEDYLPFHKCGSVVSRAVGPVDRIYGWVRNCSTWNNLVFLKGPRWKEEWDAFSKTKPGKELKVSKSLDYEVGSERKKRIIVRLDRVPRGTSK